ncbi:hypothetical protein LV780_09485 [Cereibacter azotoformans]|nr:hypothetical protein [Cereibacter azotoformans]AXQ94008.1 hypothetical protein D0Z66_09510 [Cereibacter sphaeroides]UIJ29533.1 hypothetical protein LV780_09485 [Cereibacter azotoformans]
MAQVGAKHVRPTTFCKTEAYRQGYEDYRLGRPPAFGQWSGNDIAYETGRQAAALAVAKGQDLRPIPVKGKIASHDVMHLVDLGKALFRLEWGIE